MIFSKERLNTVYYMCIASTCALHCRVPGRQGLQQIACQVDGKDNARQIALVHRHSTILQVRVPDPYKSQYIASYWPYVIIMFNMWLTRIGGVLRISCSHIRYYYYSLSMHLKYTYSACHIWPTNSTLQPCMTSCTTFNTTVLLWFLYLWWSEYCS